MNAEATLGADQDIEGVEIFKAGTYQVNGADGKLVTVSYSEQDVAQMAENANKLLAGKNYEAPAKLGHSEGQKVAHEAGLPAAGWVKRAYAKGGQLFADFKQVPALLAEAIKRGRYKYVSSEIYDPADTKRNFGSFGVEGFSLRAVAFLGADVPVVKGMKPLMLAAGADGARAVLLATAFAEAKDEERKPLMVPANRHPYGALVKMAGKEDLMRIHEIHPDGTYDAHNLHDRSKEEKAVHHDNLSLMSEMEHRALKAQTEAQTMENEAVKLAEQKVKDVEAALAASEAKIKALNDSARDSKIAAFAEKHKTVLIPALRPAFDALAKVELGAAVKLAEGKESPYLDAFLAFAESLIGAKKVQIGETAPGTGAPAAIGDAAKLAEVPFKAYATERHVDIAGADRAVKAREYAEKNKVPYKTALIAVATMEKEVA